MEEPLLDADDGSRRQHDLSSRVEPFTEEDVVGVDFWGEGARRRHLRRKTFWEVLLERGNGDFESADRAHNYTKEDEDALAAIESIDYLPQSSAVYRDWLRGQPHGRTWDRWLMMFFVGIATGIVGYLVYTLVDLLASAKFLAVRSLTGRHQAFLAWLFSATYSVALVAAASWLVVFVAPAAAGSGVPEVMAYLNGSLLPKVFNIRTLVVKVASCILAVGSGLPVGPEGPMIHIGAMLGAALSQGQSTTLGCATSFFTRLRNPKDKRDFITAGAAAGVAVAFGAPVGGLLFICEEVASFWQLSLGWQIFFACMTAVFTSNLFKSAVVALDEGHFGLFDSKWSISFEATRAVSTHVVAILPTVVIGVVCGLLAIVFTFCNLRLQRLRLWALQGKPWWQVAEPCLIVFLYVTLGMITAPLFPCVPTGCTIADGEHVVCPPGTAGGVQRIVEDSIELYTCADDPHNATDASSGAPKSYNEVATLLFVTGEDSIRHLLSRGTHREFEYGSVGVVLVLYFIGAVWAAGSAVASGLFVPMLLIGACVGRLVGLATVDTLASYGLGSAGAPAGVFLPPSPWSWVDPGVFALIGSGAFMSGVSRLTMSLAVIMVEISSEVHFLLPIMLAIMVAKWVGDACTHSLYHGLLEVKCVPFLPPHPEAPKGTSLELVTAGEVMRSPVVCLREVEGVEAVRAALRDTAHNGFPVVRDTPSGRVMVGTVLADHLKKMLARWAALPPGSALDIPFEDLDRQLVSRAAREMMEAQEMAALRPGGGGGDHGGGGQGDGGDLEGGGGDHHHHQVELPPLDLRPYLNTAAPSVRENCPVERAYIMFTTLGLRHLPVVDCHNRVAGMLTRKDLLGYRLHGVCARQQEGGIMG